MFGKYNVFIDEMIHVVLAVIHPLIVLDLGWISVYEALFLFSLGMLIDLDHILNPFIAQALDIKGTILPSHQQQGYTIKILHGIDLYFIYGVICMALSGNGAFSFGVFLVLTLHHIWDFIVYDHTWKELFFITRAMNHFYPGRRHHFTGIIFRSETLPM